jgi:hypothetical protein
MRERETTLNKEEMGNQQRTGCRVLFMQARNRKCSKSVKRHAEKCRMADGKEGQ